MMKKMKFRSLLPCLFALLVYQALAMDILQYDAFFSFDCTGSVAFQVPFGATDFCYGLTGTPQVSPFDPCVTDIRSGNTIFSARLKCVDIPDNEVANIFVGKVCSDGAPAFQTDQIVAVVGRCIRVLDTNIASSFKLIVVGDNTVELAQFAQSDECKGAFTTTTLRVGECKLGASTLIGSPGSTSALQILAAKPGTKLTSEPQSLAPVTGPPVTTTLVPTVSANSTVPLPTTAEDLSGLQGFLALLVITLGTALMLFLMEYQRLREARLFLAAIRVRDRLLFRLKMRQSSTNVHSEIPESISEMLVEIANVKTQYEIMLTEVHSRAHLDRVSMDRAVQATQLALFALVHSYNMPNQLSNNTQDSDSFSHPAAQGSKIPLSAAVTPEGDYLAITDAVIAPPLQTVNLSMAMSKIASALATLAEGTRGSFDKAKVKEAEQDAMGSIQYMYKFSLDSSISVADVVNEALADEASQWREEGQKYQKVFKQCVGLLPRFGSDKGNRSKGAQYLRYWFPRSAQFPVFYGIFLLFIITIFLSFAGKVDRTKAGLDANNRVSPGLTVGNQPFLLGGYGQTFLPVPPQYNLDERPEQASGVPVLYGVMHCVLFFLGLLPVPFMRGFWRDMVHRYPTLRRVMPIDDFTYFHRLCAWLALSGLLLGCFIWLVTLGVECANRDQAQACLGFDATNSNPVDNVLVLRFIVWMFWFPIMPLMYYVRRGPWNWLPDVIKRFYYETVYILHVATAFFTVLLALICRFTVFYPVLISWIPYILDWFREAWFHTHKVAVNETQVRWFSSIHDQRPTSVRLSFKHCVTNSNFGAGQWMYLMIPSIDYNWHPFSIASASMDQEIELHIGVIAPGIKNDTKKQEWVMPKGIETWTFRLWQLIRKPQSLRRFDALIRGPYGTAFTSCFDPRYNACVVIGAGTGLTAAESVLREIVQMRKANLATPPFTWFVWSCRRVDDIMWCWDTLIDLIYDCCKAGALDLDIISSRPSDAMNLFDWLGVAIFVTQATEEQLKEFVSYRTNLRTTEHQEVEEWLFNQIVAGALDDEDTHVRKLLRGVQRKLAASGYMGTKMTVAFCGPSTLGGTISAATQELGGNIEFSSDNQ